MCARFVHVDIATRIAKLQLFHDYSVKCHVSPTYTHNTLGRKARAASFFLFRRYVAFPCEIRSQRSDEHKPHGKKVLHEAHCLFRWRKLSSREVVQASPQQ